jgi:hypothetical protein
LVVLVAMYQMEQIKLRTERAKFEPEQAKLDELEDALENSVVRAGRH